MARFFTLTPSDVAFIDPGRGRGPADRLGLAVALCTLPWLGFVPDDVASAPRAAITRLAEQLQVDSDAIRSYGRRAKTRTDHVRSAAQYLRWRPAGELELKELDEFLLARAMEHDSPTLVGVSWVCTGALGSGVMWDKMGTRQGETMSELTTTQPAGTPTWIDLGIPDLDRAMTFYGALFGWEFDVGPAEFGHYTQCLLRGRPVAAIRPNPDPDATDFWWNVYFATDDCDAAAARARDAGGSIITGPMDVLDQGRTAIIKDTTGAQCGLWQAGAHIGCEIVNEPNALLRNDLVTAESGPARDFYVAVFGYTLDANPDMPELDFTFLRRPDGHEIGGIAGDPKATKSRWGTLFQVDDADAAARRAVDAGGTSAEPYDMIYGRVAHITDPFGTEFDVGAVMTS
ncbi:DUF4158 domain-containing protein [Actinomadura rudentiformis]|nr:DUF4158 domain-containing protein [Actinomadura rudentiformis]